MRPQESILVAPISVTCLGTLVYSSVRIGEHEPYIQMGQLLLNEQMFLAVVGTEDALGLDDDTVPKNEVRCVGALLLRLNVGYAVGFVLIHDATGAQ